MVRHLSFFHSRHIEDYWEIIEPFCSKEKERHTVFHRLHLLTVKQKQSHTCHGDLVAGLVGPQSDEGPSLFESVKRSFDGEHYILQ